MNVQQIQACLADGINPVRFCSLCGSSNPHVLCKECCDGIADEMNMMADAVAEMTPEPTHPYGWDSVETSTEDDFVQRPEREYLRHSYDGMDW